MKDLILAEIPPRYLPRLLAEIAKVTGASGVEFMQISHYEGCPYKFGPGGRLDGCTCDLVQLAFTSALISPEEARRIVQELFLRHVAENTAAPN